MKKILLVDDEQINLFILENLLRLSDINVEVIFFNTSRKAIDYLKEIETDPKKKPDVILLDIEMPVMNGWDFLSEYQQISPVFTSDIHVVIFTTSIVDQDRMKAMSYNVVEKFFNKPMTVEMLKTIEQEYLLT